MSDDQGQREIGSRMYVFAFVVAAIFLFSGFFAVIPSPDGNWAFGPNPKGLQVPQLFVGLVLTALGAFLYSFDIVTHVPQPKSTPMGKKSDGTSVASVQPPESQTIIRVKYENLPITHRRALEAVFTSSRGVMTLPEVERAMTYSLPELSTTGREWKSVLFDLVDQRMLLADTQPLRGSTFRINPALQDQPAFRVHPEVATFFIEEDIPST